MMAWMVPMSVLRSLTRAVMDTFIMVESMTMMNWVRTTISRGPQYHFLA